MSKKTLYTLAAITTAAALGGYLLYKYIRKVQDIETEQTEGDSEPPNTQPNVDFEFPASNLSSGFVTGVENFDIIAGTKNFSIDQFNSKDGVAVPQRYMANVQQVMNQLEIVRTALGGKDIRVTNGYRSVQHNRDVGGEPKSMHLIGKAADIQVGGYYPSQIKFILEKLIAEGKILQGGIGLYSNFVHYDIRGNRARWSGK